MYLLPVLLLMVIFPVISVGIEHFFFHGTIPLMSLVGKWFVFWGAGVRLVLAGIRQFFQPRFTAQQIFGLTGDEPLPIVRELGVANFATGTVGVLSLLKPGFVLPVSIAAAVFYGVAGIRHATDKHKNQKQQFAMITDLLAFVVFVAYIVFAMSR
ncbi:MAG TPA: DUF6790 family protein [Candidatus Acidoferrum sp.]|nr:DUF6790 family protein [Candidatus Acidoferrum sp.]